MAYYNQHVLKIFITHGTREVFYEKNPKPWKMISLFGEKRVQDLLNLHIDLFSDSNSTRLTLYYSHLFTDQNSMILFLHSLISLVNPSIRSPCMPTP
jgi:hypothetical protein